MWSPTAYQASDFLMRQTGDELVSRLSLLTLQPKVILDVGCATGELSLALKERYPEAVIISLDLDHGMLAHGRPACPVQADTQALPLRAESVDLVVAHGVLPWVGEWAPVLKEWRRVLRPEGVLMVTALGPDTLKSCYAKDPTPWPVRIDMHDLGDALIQAGFHEPVLDVRDFNIRYTDLSRCETDLAGMGLVGLSLDLNAFTVTARGVTPPSGRHNLEFEFIFALTFAPHLRDGFSDDDGVTRVPLDALRAALRAGRPEER